MNNIDQKIQAALQRDDEAGATASSLSDEVLNAFRGRSRLLSVCLVVTNLAVFAGLVFAAMRFLGAAVVGEQLRWLLLTGVLLMVLSLAKIWFWMEMHSTKVLREVKRIELLLAARKEVR